MSAVEVEGPGWIERAAGWASGRLLLTVARRAAARGDAHELLHCKIALLEGNSGHPAEDCESELVHAAALAELRRRLDAS